jgi:7-cyano-7-deazaguanine reductase
LFRCIVAAVCVRHAQNYRDSGTSHAIEGQALYQQAWIGRGSGYNSRMPKSPRHTSPRYTAEHASAGLDHDFPEIETWPNQFPGYEIVVDDPEFTSVCPKTGLPDFGNIVIRYVPDRLCLELKSLKEYLQAYRNLGIFQENIVNQVLEDVVRWAKPVWAEVKGEFRPRGGISTIVIARWPRGKKGQK